VGHVLGLGDHPGGNDIMTTTLDAGMRRLPEALSSTGNVTASTGVSAVAPAAFRVSDLGGVQLSVPPSTLARTGTVEVALPTGVRDGSPASSGTAAIEAMLVATRGLTPAATAQDGLGSLAGIPRNFALPAPILSAVATPPAAVSTGTDRDATSDLVPGIWPPSPPTESGDGAALEDSEGEQAGVLAPAANPGEALLWQGARDAYFASDWAAWLADSAPIRPEEATQAADTPAAVALALALTGWWGVRAMETETRRRQRILIDSI
jgi:hypothetical protein